MNSSAEDHNRTHHEQDDRLGRTNAYSHAEADDSFDVLQGEDDIHKFRKLVEAFRLKFGENNAFQDTFIDSQIYEKTMNSEDYLRISVDLMKYILHSSFNLKKKEDQKSKSKVYGGMGLK